MTVTDYPTFVPGQSLTADELNLLAQHTFDRDRLIGRLIGFGVNGGLGGTLAANTLTVTAGLAVDQQGEPLIMPAPWSRTFPTSGAPADLSTVNYPFIVPWPSTYSLVLVAEDDDVELITCGDADCAGHAEHHTRSVRMDLVPGRVNSAHFAFADHPLLDAIPLVMDAGGSIVGSLSDLKAAISSALDEIQPPITSVTKANLTNLTIPSGDFAALKGYKAGWINRLLFATIAALRCQALAAIPALRDATPAGVVLGAMERTSGGWVFHCDWRHAWEPPTGLTAALLGGSCTNICGPARDYVKDALGIFTPPTPPPVVNPPSGDVPPLKWCVGHWKNCVLEHVPGPELKYPIKEIVFERKKPPFVIDLGDPPDGDDYRNVVDTLTNPVQWVREAIDTTFGSTQTNTLGDGYLDGTPLVGLMADVAAEVAAINMVEHGGVGTVHTVPSSQITTTVGAARSLAFSPSDTLVLGKNTAGIVVDMAIVPALTTLRANSAMSGRVDLANANAGEGLAIAKGVETHVNGLQTQWEGTFGTLEGRMSTLQTEFSGFRGSTSGFAVLENRVGMLENESTKHDLLGERLAKLEGKAIAQTGNLGTKAYTVDVGNSLAEFAQTTVGALKTIDEPRNQNLKKYIATVELKQSELEIAVRAGDPEIVAGATMNLLDSMRTMVGASGVDAASKRQLDAQFRAMKGMLG